MVKLIDLTGQKFGLLTVIEKAPSRNRHTMWKCLCDCGNECEVSGEYLKKDAKQIRSCGCQFKKKIKEKQVQERLDWLLNKRFGRLVVIERLNQSDVYGTLWKCQCDCGNQIIRGTGLLTSGHTQSCGCIKYSMGEQIIERILKENNIRFCSQYTEPTLERKRFDFAILDEEGFPIRIIEFDGRQHYEEVPLFKEGLEVIKQKDIFKNQWAKENNIPLVRIPYWERDNITLDMILGDKYLIC